MSREGCLPTRPRESLAVNRAATGRSAVAVAEAAGAGGNGVVARPRGARAAPAG